MRKWLDWRLKTAADADAQMGCDASLDAWKTFYRAMFAFPLAYCTLGVMAPGQTAWSWHVSVSIPKAASAPVVLSRVFDSAFQDVHASYAGLLRQWRERAQWLL